MKFIGENFYKLFLVALLVILPALSFAQDITPSRPTGDITPSNPCEGKICNPINSNTIQEFIRVLLEGMLKIGIPLVALAVIYCGFLFVQARGKPEEITKAKDALLYTLVGAAILLGSWAIAKLISDTVLAL